MSPKKFTLGLTLGLAHLVLVIVMAIWIYSQINIEKDFLTPFMTWLVFHVIDFPVSWLLNLFPSFTSGPDTSFTLLINNLLIPVLFYGLIGSLQYFLIGTGLQMLLSKMKKTKR